MFHRKGFDVKGNFWPTSQSKAVETMLNVCQGKLDSSFPFAVALASAPIAFSDWFKVEFAALNEFLKPSQTWSSLIAPIRIHKLCL